MIGVLCHDQELPVVRELFQLFKTPWSRWRPAESYDAVIATTTDSVAALGARVTIVFGAAETADDVAAGRTLRRRLGGRLDLDGVQLPLYGAVATFAGSAGSVRVFSGLGPVVVVEDREDGGGTLVRCGYDLVAEVAHLLTTGQPAEHAATPTLDLHIELLRSWLLEAGVPLVEIPAILPGSGLAACLTHDVDFLGIRRHRLDRTLLGFLHRASIGTALDLARRRRTLRQAVRNWLAVLSLPLVHAGIVRDPWLPFEHYRRAEGARRSTFFVIPFRDHAGQGCGGPPDPRRAVPYGAAEAASDLEQLVELGFEVGVHGIDAWADAGKGREESDEVACASGRTPAGVRMHWLYFDAESYARLDAAGFDYDASCGYNDAVGFRAGTAQVFRPLTADHLLELPLHVQDTALLFPGRMRLSDAEAMARCDEILDRAERHGGVVSISWHERSLAPERLWDGVYEQVLDSLRRRGATILTAAEAVAWFRARRAIDLEDARLELSRLDAAAAGSGEIRLRVHRPGQGFHDVPVGIEHLRSLIAGPAVARAA